MLISLSRTLIHLHQTNNIMNNNNQTINAISRTSTTLFNNNYNNNIITNYNNNNNIKYHQNSLKAYQDQHSAAHIHYVGVSSSIQCTTL